MTVQLCGFRRVAGARKTYESSLHWLRSQRENIAAKTTQEIRELCLPVTWHLLQIMALTAMWFLRRRENDRICRYGKHHEPSSDCRRKARNAQKKLHRSDGEVWIVPAYWFRVDSRVSYSGTQTEMKPRIPGSIGATSKDLKVNVIPWYSLFFARCAEKNLLLVNHNKYLEKFEREQAEETLEILFISFHIQILIEKAAF